MKRRANIYLIICLILLLFANLYGRAGIQKIRKNLLITYKAPHSQLSADLLKILAGEFKGLWADYQLLEIGSFIGTNQLTSPDDWKNIHKAFQNALVLDPYFQQTYIYIQGTLPWNGKMYNETIELLEISKKYRPWDWRPGYYMGFDYYYFLNDYAEASKELLANSKIAGAPVLLAVLGARFAMRSQQTDAAILMLQKMLQDEAYSGGERSELQMRLSALENVRLLQKAVDQYQAVHKHYPPTLETLIQEKMINAMPKNPYDDHFYYDPAAGQVAFDALR